MSLEVIIFAAGKYKIEFAAFYNKREQSADTFPYLTLVSQRRRLTTPDTGTWLREAIVSGELLLDQSRWDETTFVVRHNLDKWRVERIMMYSTRKAALDDIGFSSDEDSDNIPDELEMISLAEALATLADRGWLNK